MEHGILPFKIQTLPCPYTVSTMSNPKRLIVLNFLRMPCYSITTPSSSYSRSATPILSKTFFKKPNFFSSSFNDYFQQTLGRTEVGRLWVEDDMVQDKWVSKKGETPKFIPLFPSLPLCGDLLIVQTCLKHESWKKCVGSRMGGKGWTPRNSQTIVDRWPCRMYVHFT